MIVIDVDSHSEPRREDYVIGPEYKCRSRHFYVDLKGRRYNVFDGKVLSRFATAEKGKTFKAGPFVLHPEYYDASVRHEHITNAGIDIQLITAGSVTHFLYVEPRMGAAFCRAYNDFLYDKFMKAYPKNFIGLPQLPLQDIHFAIKELERCVKDLGMPSFVMPTNWNGIDMADPYWWNFYDAVRELGLTTIVVHVEAVAPDSRWVGKERLAVLGPDGTRGRRIASTPFENCSNVINLLFGGMMDAFPEFRFVFLEGGTEFAIALKHRMEESVRELPYLAEMLSEPVEKYFDRLYFTVDQFLLDNNGRGLKYAVEELGANHLLLGTDYPHEIETLEMCAEVKNLSGLEVHAKERILGKNALTLFDGKLP